MKRADKARAGKRRPGVRALVSAVAILAAVTVLAVSVRAVNGARFPQPAWEALSLEQAVQSGADDPRFTIERVAGEYLDGFHLRPAPTGARESPARGLVMTWGGSDGGANDALALTLATEGHEVLALRFFGQRNQQPVLSQIPLEFFGEALRYAAAHACSPRPLTIIGTSKGAELALVLPTYYPGIDNVVVFTPSEHVYQGLDFTTSHASWTWQGRDLPYVSFRHAAPTATMGMLAAMALNVPVRLRETYRTATERDPGAEAARIDVSRITGQLLVFAGDDDRMWPGEVAARNLAAAWPDHTEIHVYPGAGHVFGLPGWHAAGYELGGTTEANAAAAAESTTILQRRLADWSR